MLRAPPGGWVDAFLTLRFLAQASLYCFALALTPLTAVGGGTLFTETFDSVALRDDAGTHADWNTADGVLRLPPGVARTLSFTDMVVGLEGSSVDIEIIDANGDGLPDVISGRDSVLFYANNGTSMPFEGAIASPTSGSNWVFGLALGDLNVSGRPDLVIGSQSQFFAVPSRVKLNNGSADPFTGVAATQFGGFFRNDNVRLGDLDGDGLLDVVGSGAQPRIWWNNGTDAPFTFGDGWTLLDTFTASVELADMNDDGHLDVVLTGGVSGAADAYLFLNNGTAAPFDGVIATEIGGPLAAGNSSLGVADLDGDGLVDIAVAGFSNPGVRVYFNNGTATPFSGVTATPVTDLGKVDIASGDIDGDGNLDLITAAPGPTLLYLNNGTADPFDGVVPIQIGTVLNGNALDLSDVDADGDLDVGVARGNSTIGMTDVVFRSEAAPARGPGFAFDTSRTRATSLAVDDAPGNISYATLSAVATMPANTAIDYFLSNNGGLGWYQVRLDEQFCFPTAGSALRWRVELQSLSPAVSPVLDSVSINIEPVSDTDCDTIVDVTDNCTLVPNLDQRDSNGDGFGNLCDGDFNGDCRTNIADLAIMKAGFLGADPDLDLDGSGSVNIADLAIFKGLFLGQPGPSGLAACP